MALTYGADNEADNHHKLKIEYGPIVERFPILCRVVSLASQTLGSEFVVVGYAQIDGASTVQLVSATEWDKLEVADHGRLAELASPVCIEALAYITPVDRSADPYGMGCLWN